MHNNSRFNHEGNCDEHESATRRRVDQGVYPDPIYAFDKRIDYKPVDVVEFRKHVLYEMKKAA